MHTFQDRLLSPPSTNPSLQPQHIEAGAAAWGGAARAAPPQRCFSFVMASNGRRSGRGLHLGGAARLVPAYNCSHWLGGNSNDVDAAVNQEMAVETIHNYMKQTCGFH